MLIRILLLILIQRMLLNNLFKRTLIVWTVPLTGVKCPTRRLNKRCYDSKSADLRYVHNEDFKHSTLEVAK